MFNKYSSRHLISRVFQTDTGFSRFHYCHDLSRERNNNLSAGATPITCLSLHNLLLTGVAEEKSERQVRLYQKIRNAENVPHLALIKQNSEHKIIKTILYEYFRKSPSTRENFPRLEARYRPENFPLPLNVSTLKFPAVWNVSPRALLAILASTFIAFNSLVKAESQGDEGRKKAVEILLTALNLPLFILGHSEITRVFDFIGLYRVLCNNNHHSVLFVSSRQTNKYNIRIIKHR